MENEKKYCPLIKDDCKQERCMLYYEDFNDCWFNEIKESLETMAAVLDDKGISVEVINE